MCSLTKSVNIYLHLILFILVQNDWHWCFPKFVLKQVISFAFLKTTKSFFCKYKEGKRQVTTMFPSQYINSSWSGEQNSWCWALHVPQNVRFRWAFWLALTWFHGLTFHLHLGQIKWALGKYISVQLYQKGVQIECSETPLWCEPEHNK